MGFLSNLFSRTAHIPPAISKVSPAQMNAAVRLLLARPGFMGDTAQAVVFAQSLKARGIDLFDTRVISRGRKLTHAVLPCVFPGKSLLFVSGTPQKKRRADAARLIGEIVEEFSRRDVRLMQVLLEMGDELSAGVYEECGFKRLTALVYLQTPAVKLSWNLPDGVTLESLSEANEAEFAAAIERSYEGSLDCPALNGVRTTEETIAGHKSAGEFDPKNWLLVRDNGMAAGVLLLARALGVGGEETGGAQGSAPARGSEELELVYIGLSPRLRGRGVADALMRRAITRAWELGCKRLTTVVDADNGPAMRMYVRNGMTRTGARLAMVRVIHREGADSSTIHPQRDK